MCIALASPAAVAAQGRRAPDPMWSTFVAGPLSGLGEIVGSAAQALRAFWSGDLVPPPPPPPPYQPHSESGSCLDPDGRPMPCKPDF
ncbi:MAG TPA: hypothetical protein VE078_16955 [Thermoanaerobaculia bacterium]|nr:hypothetical protein [Thermoanaerobaculia bacterium]